MTEPAIVLAPDASTTAARDPGDPHLWDLLAARVDLRLVTGDKLLFESGANAHRIITPRAFVDSW